jgi:hypothetical protein
MLLDGNVAAVKSRKHQCILYIQLQVCCYKMAAASAETTVGKKLRYHSTSLYVLPITQYR